MKKPKRKHAGNPIVRAMALRYGQTNTTHRDRRERRSQDARRHEVREQMQDG